MRQLPDAATLDALVLGTAGATDAEAWEALVLEPGGAEAWDEAVARRRRVDALARAVRGRAWLARALRAVLRAARRARSAPGLELSVSLPDTRFDELIGATLGPVEEDLPADVQRPAWGRVVPVRVRLGERITLQASSDTHLDVRYLSAREEGPLPTRTWKLEPGDAPVLLVALVGGGASPSVVEALGAATAVAGVLLLEATTNGETSA